MPVATTLPSSLAGLEPAASPSVGTADDAVTVPVAGTGSPLNVAPETVERLVEEHLPIASSTVAAMLTRVPGWVRQDDLYSAAVVGLFEAAQRWDETTGVPFAAYARPRVKGAVLDELRRGDWAPRSVRRTARAENEAAQALGAELGRTPTDEELAARVGVSVAQLRQARQDAVQAWTTPFLLGEHAEHEPAGTPQAGATPEEILEDRELYGYLQDAIAALPGRRAEVVRRYYLEGEEMRAIAEDWGVTVSRVSQIAADAVSMLRDGLTGVLTPPEPAALDTPPGTPPAPAPKAALAQYQAQIQQGSTLHERLSTPVARHDD